MRSLIADINGMIQLAEEQKLAEEEKMILVSGVGQMYRHQALKRGNDHLEDAVKHGKSGDHHNAGLSLDKAKAYFDAIKKNNLQEAEIQLKNPHRKGTLKHDIWQHNRDEYLKSYSQDPHGKLQSGDSIAGPSGTSKIKEAVEAKLQMTMPLFIRLMEWAREECKDDVEIHRVAEALATVNDVADMDDYEGLFESEELTEVTADLVVKIGAKTLNKQKGFVNLTKTLKRISRDCERAKLDPKDRKGPIIK